MLFPCELDFCSACGGAHTWLDCELKHELPSEWDERSECLQQQTLGFRYQLLDRSSTCGELVKKYVCLCICICSRSRLSLIIGSGRTALCKMVFGFTGYNFCWSFHCRCIENTSFKTIKNC